MELGVVQVIPKIFFMPAAPLTEVYRSSRRASRLGMAL